MCGGVEQCGTESNPSGRLSAPSQMAPSGDMRPCLPKLRSPRLCQLNRDSAGSQLGFGFPIAPFNLITNGQSGQSQAKTTKTLWAREEALTPLLRAVQRLLESSSAVSRNAIPVFRRGLVHGRRCRLRMEQSVALEQVRVGCAKPLRALDHTQVSSDLIGHERNKGERERAEEAFHFPSPQNLISLSVIDTIWIRVNNVDVARASVAFALRQQSGSEREWSRSLASPQSNLGPGCQNQANPRIR